MTKKENSSQSYSQAPWRKQLQFIGLFSLVLVFLALVAGIYLNISARAAYAGRQVQDIQRDLTDYDLEIENLQAQLAWIQSTDVMEERAHNMGFAPVIRDEIVFLTVEGYRERSPVKLAPYTGRLVAIAPTLPAEYTESLYTWFQRQAFSVTSFTVEVLP